VYIINLLDCTQGCVYNINLFLYSELALETRLKWQSLLVGNVQLCVLNCSSLIVLHFYASWAPQCEQVDDVLAELNRDSSLTDAVKFVKVF